MVFLVLVLLGAGAASAEDAYDLYKRKEYAKAELAFVKLLKKEPKNSNLYKFMGICQYMQGKRRAAEISFQQAKSLSRSLRIRVAEVEDPGVVEFFSAVQVPRKIKPAVAELRVDAFPSSAALTVDGSPMTLGQVLKLKAGQHEILVVAPGYLPLRRRLHLKLGQRENLHLQLRPLQTKVVQKKQAPTPPAKLEKPKELIKTKKPKKTEKIQTELKPQQDRYKLFPFGVSAFQQGRTAIGVTLALTQTAGIFGAWWFYSQALDTAAATNSWIKERSATEATLPVGEQDAFREATIAERKKRQGKLDQQYYLFLGSCGLFLSSWAWSIWGLEQQKLAFNCGPDCNSLSINYAFNFN